MKFCHVTISVKIMDESLRFYQDIIGLPLKRRFPAGAGMEIAFLGNDDETEVELICIDSRKDILAGQDISLGFEVMSVQETIETLRKNDIITGEIIQPNPQAKFFYISDPNGVKIQFIEYVK